VAQQPPAGDDARWWWCDATVPDLRSKWCKLELKGGFPAIAEAIPRRLITLAAVASVRVPLRFIRTVRRVMTIRTERLLDSVSAAKMPSTAAIRLSRSTAT